MGIGDTMRGPILEIKSQARIVMAYSMPTRIHICNLSASLNTNGREACGCVFTLKLEIVKEKREILCNYGGTNVI